MAKAIDGDELLGIERLLDTDVVRQSKTASWLLDQVLHDIQAMPTLTPPNEWVSRMREIEELYAKLRAVTGCSLEQIIEMFAAGYTLEKPDYSNETMDRLDETTPPNEPLTCEGCMYAPDLPYEIHCRGCARLYADHYRRLPEGEEDT